MTRDRNRGRNFLKKKFLKKNPYTPISFDLRAHDGREVNSF